MRGSVPLKRRKHKTPPQAFEYEALIYTLTHAYMCQNQMVRTAKKTAAARPRDLVGYGAHRRLTVTPTIFTRIDHQQRAMARRSCTAKQSMARYACVLIFSARATNGELSPNMLAMTTKAVCVAPK